MEMLRKPLAMSMQENLADLKEARTKEERQRAFEGNAEGNRHERRLAAKRERQKLRQQVSAMALILCVFLVAGCAGPWPRDCQSNFFLCKK